MNINLLNVPHIIFFVFFLGFLSIVSSYCLGILLPDMPFWMETLSPLASYGILFWLFDKYAWKWKIFKFLSVRKFPNLNGKWKGLQKSSYKENDKCVEVQSYIEIKQSFSKVYITSYYERSQSSSVVASFADFQDETFLYYTYDNEPNTEKVGTMQKHRGTVKLKCIPNTKLLSGRYFNDNGNDGEIDLEYIGKELSYKFGDNS